MKTPLEVLKLYPSHDYTLAGAFASRLQAGPQREFLVHQNRRWSWQSFSDASLKLARTLTARGIKKGDRVAYVSTLGSYAEERNVPAAALVRW